MRVEVLRTFRISKPNERRRLLPKAILAVLSVSLSFAFAEFVDRVFLPEASDTIIVPIESIDEKYHHRLKVFPIAPPMRDAARIAFVGDSFTWGTGVKDRSTKAFPALVGRFFCVGSVDGIERRAVQTFNLGTASYSPSIYGVVLRDFAPILKPDVVVLALDDSDPQDDLYYRYLLKKDEHGLPLSVYPGLPGVPDFLVPIAKRFKLVRHVSGVFAKVTKRVKGRIDERTKPENRYGHYRPGPGSVELWAEAFDRSLCLVDAFHQYCLDHEIKLVIINYPYAPAVTTHFSSTWKGITFNFTRGVILEPIFHKAVADFASARSIPYYDFTPYLRSLPEHEGIYNDEDGHYSEKGYELLAIELVRFLAPIVDEVTARRLGRQ